MKMIHGPFFNDLKLQSYDCKRLHNTPPDCYGPSLVRDKKKNELADGAENVTHRCGYNYSFNAIWTADSPGPWKNYPRKTYLSYYRLTELTLHTNNLDLPRISAKDLLWYIFLECSFHHTVADYGVSFRPYITEATTPSVTRRSDCDPLNSIEPTLPLIVVLTVVEWSGGGSHSPQSTHSELMWDRQSILRYPDGRIMIGLTLCI